MVVEVQNGMVKACHRVVNRVVNAWTSELRGELGVGTADQTGQV